MAKSNESAARKAAPKLATSPSAWWWRTSFYVDFAKRIRKDPGGGVQGEHSLTEAAAWCYELVKRLPICERDQPPNLHRQDWPSFLELLPCETDYLIRMVQKLLGYRLIWRAPSEASELQFYSDPLPNHCLDLLSDDAPLIRWFNNWIASQRLTHGVQRGEGHKQGTSHNKRDIPRVIDWTMVELLEHQKGKMPPLTETQRCSHRRRAFQFARKYLPHVREALVEACDSPIWSFDLVNSSERDGE